MCDFDLSQALDGSPDLDQTGCESSCFNMTDVQEEVISLDAGLDLVISRNPTTMRGAVTLVVAVKRLQKSLHGASSWELSDGDLCRAIMDNLVDETLVPTEASVTREARQVYSRLPSTECSLMDTHKKDIVCSSDRLQAVTLTGGNFHHKVNFRLASLCRPGPAPTQTCCLSIRSPVQQKLYLSCKRNNDNNVELHLEECSDDLKHGGADIERFLFYKTDEGVSLSYFESVLHPGWFISTSETENQPVEMCRVDSAQRVTRFNVARR